MAPQPAIGGASLSDILTTAKNIVTAINQLGQNYLNVQGARSATAIAAAKVLKTSAGRVCVVSVTTAGTSTGTIYDASATGVTTNPVAVIPEAVGIYIIDIPTNFGIVVVPGSGMVVAVSYS